MHITSTPDAAYTSHQRILTKGGFPVTLALAGTTSVLAGTPFVLAGTTPVLAGVEVPSYWLAAARIGSTVGLAQGLDLLAAGQAEQVRGKMLRALAAG